MRFKVSLLGLLAFVACAAGEDDDDAAGTDETGTIGDDAGTSATTATTATTGATSVTSTTTGATSVTASSTTDPDTGPDDTDDTADTGPDDTSGGADLSCASYCAVYLDACADFTAFANEQDCLDNCAQWPVGTAADTADDTLGCRLYHATVASSTDPEMHCPHASPNGAETCAIADAPTCDLYCTRVLANCTGELNTFVDMADCMDQCGDWYPGTEGDVDGHTVGCHSYHANAALGDAETHCPHAAPGGGGICVL